MLRQRSYSISKGVFWDLVVAIGPEAPSRDTSAVRITCWKPKTSGINAECPRNDCSFWSDCK